MDNTESMVERQAIAEAITAEIDASIPYAPEAGGLNASKHFPALRAVTSRSSLGRLP